MNHFTVPKKIYFEKNSLQYLIKMENVDRALLISCPKAIEAGFVDTTRNMLSRRKNFVSIEVFSVEKNAEEAAIEENLKLVETFKANTILAVGCPHVIRVAKEVAAKSGLKLAIIPTTSSVGNEMTFATDEKTLAEIVIVDAQFVAEKNASSISKGGLQVLANAIGSFLSENANDYSRGFSLQATKTVLANLEKAVNTTDFDAREHIHNAAAVAGIAANNTQFSGNFEGVLNELQVGENEEKAEEIASFVGLENVETLVSTLNKIKELA